MWHAIILCGDVMGKICLLLLLLLNHVNEWILQKRTSITITLCFEVQVQLLLRFLL